MGGGQQGARADFSAWRRWNAPFVPRGELKGPDNGAARWCSLRHTLARKRVKRITLEASAGACGFSSRSRACRRARHCAKFCTGRVLPIPPSQEQSSIVALCVFLKGATMERLRYACRPALRSVRIRI
jgi:hypothetical protein